MRRRGMGEAEASSPSLRGSRGGCTTSPFTPGNSGLVASRYSSTFLQSSLTPGEWDGGSAESGRGQGKAPGLWAESPKV